MMREHMPCPSSSPSRAPAPVLLTHLRWRAALPIPPTGWAAPPQSWPPPAPAPASTAPPAPPAACRARGGQAGGRWVVGGRQAAAWTCSAAGHKTWCQQAHTHHTAQPPSTRRKLQKCRWHCHSQSRRSAGGAPCGMPSSTRAMSASRRRWCATVCTRVEAPAGGSTCGEVPAKRDASSSRQAGRQAAYMHHGPAHPHQPLRAPSTPTPTPHAPLCRWPARAPSPAAPP